VDNLRGAEQPCLIGHSYVLLHSAELNDKVASTSSLAEFTHSVPVHAVKA